MRDRQLQVVDAVLARVQGRTSKPLAWSLPDVQLAGLATGLTALAATSDVFAADAPEVRDYLVDQQRQVAGRVERFREVTPRVLAALASADLVAVPVKGAVLTGAAGDDPVWPQPATRPMSDIDLLVAPHQRAQAAAVLARGGWSLHSSSDHEDTFLAWGDGGQGRLDGESVEHNGRVEVHPGWVEFLHGYLACGFELRPHLRHTDDGQWRLSNSALAAHVIGHLASTVVRAEVRAVNVVDVWFLHARGVDWSAIGEVQQEVDPRLTAPGLWLVDRLLPDVVPPWLLQRELARLPHPDVLDALSPASVLRDPTQRTTMRWRSSFASSVAERAAVGRQASESVVARVRRR
ncbi:MAG: nucleotidyltransferase family protein [Actinobacteria bacterium]|nr:nucleotidyltransferase family protein [Actinomycetota bacterium]